MVNPVFTITSQPVVEGKFSYEAKIIPTHEVFEGHFPGTPVVPGVCTIAMLRQCVGDAVKRKVNFRQIKECKFLSAIVPDTHSTLDVQLQLKDSQDGEIAVTAIVRSNETIMLKLKAVAQ